MPGLFISYRREDSAGYAGRLFDILVAEFGNENTFMDLDTIEGGDNFAEVIKAKVGISDVLLAVIGNRWATITDESGRRRLDNTGDFVRSEIANALELGIRVIPVLVGGAVMPRADDLPADLRGLCERQAVEIRDEDFHPDSQQLTQMLHKDLPGIGRGPFKSRLTRFAAAMLAGVGAIVIILAAVLFLNRAKEPGVAGKWTALVKYDWGDSYNTFFDFEVDGPEISGMAGYGADRVGNGRAILNGKIAGDRISFMTKSHVTMDFSQPSAEERHYYKGKVEGGAIRFTLTTEGPIQHSPIQFSAQRLKPDPPRH